MAFRVGQEVVCVDAVPVDWVWADCVHPITVGEVYRVRDIATDPKDDTGNYGVLLEGITNPPHFDAGELCYGSWQFRPVVKTDISIFTKMLAPEPNAPVRKPEKVEG